MRGKGLKRRPFPRPPTRLNLHHNRASGLDKRQAFQRRYAPQTNLNPNLVLDDPDHFLHNHLASVAALRSLIGITQER
jgi:hypothetical protein